jgi:hypothetical protein
MALTNISKPSIATTTSPSTGTRYWVGGSGNWAGTTHWSATSGGASGASEPTSTVNVIIDSNSGLSGGTITINSVASVNNFTSTTGFSYTITQSAGNFKVYGSLTLESTINAPTLSLDLYSTYTANTITTAGVTLNNFSCLGTGAWSLQDNLTITGQFYLDNGAFNANNKNITANDFYVYSDTGNTPTFYYGTGTFSPAFAFWAVDDNNGVYLNFFFSPSSLNNSSKASSAELWSSISTTWASETRTWADCISLIDNNSKPSTSITNTSKPA